MRSWASILHLDLDAFFAAVEQRDKPSLRDKPVIVGGTGPRGVVSTASYEARRFGIRSAMSGTEAHRRAPNAAFLAGRFDAYKQSSKVVMKLLGELSPLVEPMSLDEAFVDLAAGGHQPDQVEELVHQLRADVTRLTAGLTASVGLGTSKFMAKVASEMAKPNGVRHVLPGTEIETIAPLPIRAIPGIGPVGENRLNDIGIRTVADLQRAGRDDLKALLGESWGESLANLAQALDHRPVIAEREVKSISTEDTFVTDITDQDELKAVLRRDSANVAARLANAKLFARTVSIKVRLADFTTMTRGRTLDGATGDGELITAMAINLLEGVDIAQGVRLLGVGVSGFATSAQESLFNDVNDTLARSKPEVEQVEVGVSGVARSGARFRTGMEVEHPDLGRGWVWGSGLGRVSVRFETRHTGIGPVRTLWEDELSPAELLDLPSS